MYVGIYGLNYTETWLDVMQVTAFAYAADAQTGMLPNFSS